MKFDSQGGASAPASRITSSTKAARRKSGSTQFHPLVLAVMFVFFSADARAETTSTLSGAEIQGRQLAQQLCEAQPTVNFTNTGVLLIRDAGRATTPVPVKFETIVTETGWLNIYETISNSNNVQTVLKVEHGNAVPNQYQTENKTAADVVTRGHGWFTADSRLFTPFAGSDFWLCDLGLEFFHWPEQKVLPNPTSLKRGRSYTLLESTNPSPSTNGYSRVLSWIDRETGGILQAEAYDPQGRRLKEFMPKSFKKVNGQWEIQEMEIDNIQTGSRTRLEFDLKK